MSDAYSTVDAVTVTIKYKDANGKGFDEPWAVFKGSVESVRRGMVDFFGLDPEEVKDYSGHMLTMHVNSMAHGVQHFMATLGAEVIEDVQDEVTEKPAANADSQLEIDIKAMVEKLGEAKTKQDASRIWAQHKNDHDGLVFKDQRVKDAYNNVGKN